MNITINAYKPEHQPVFYRLNKTWIEEYFTLEPLDIAVLSDPQKHILDGGGCILVAEADGDAAGVVALRKLQAGIFELTKMAVDERYRKEGIGRKLMQACIDKGRELGLEKLVLYSNRTHNAPAVALYRKMNFVEVPMGDALYGRGDIKMEYRLTS
ncbi:MAG TPA: GNAT family N-acetyltransferase [Bacteroidia bacterium]|jgi:ribosomal protein S18 acetylase RimI-like enzyme|nr:GNAT family N-acetyltransferase [Bacteroidia bacterium]